MNKVIQGIARVMASLVLAIAVSGPLHAQSDPAAMQNLVLQMQQMQEEIRELRGIVEKQAYEIENLKVRQKDQYLDLDARISDAQGGISNRPQLNPPTQSGSAVVTSPGVLDRPEISTRPNNNSQTSAIRQPGVETRNTAVQPENEKALYEDAFGQLRALQYTEAAEGFLTFLDRYPQSELAGNAQYWLGESYYVTRNYDIALEAFHGLLELYPDSNKVADAWLKIGYTHYELKEWEKSRDTLLRVKDMYPDSRLSRLADSRLRTMRLDGQ
jgi:tol-pal system protein YbgF